MDKKNKKGNKVRNICVAILGVTLILTPPLSTKADAVEGGQAFGIESPTLSTTKASMAYAQQRAIDKPVVKNNPSTNIEDKKAKRKEAGKKKAKKAIATLKATWYTGDVLGSTGSGGKLYHAKSIALNNSQRKSLGIKYGQELYLKFPTAHKNLNGWYEVKDSGCSRGIVDVYYKTKGSVPSKFKRAGIIRKVKMFTKVKSV
ncbi:MAG: hypothetical protein LBO70_05070 [Clostridiales Family XIII bacterium]|nr:hypothetical protein [Clostridiales Family XIII bacterium]